jgi:hypothetical protein
VHAFARIVLPLAICCAIGVALPEALNLPAWGCWIVWGGCIMVGGALGGLWADRYRRRVLPATLQREERCTRLEHSAGLPDLWGVDDPHVRRSIRRACLLRTCSIGYLALSAGIAGSVALLAALLVDFLMWHGWREYLAFLVTVGPAVALLSIWHARRVSKVCPAILAVMGRCTNCGYQLDLQMNGRCPECGQERCRAEHEHTP